MYKIITRNRQLYNVCLKKPQAKFEKLSSRSLRPLRFKFQLSSNAVAAILPGINYRLYSAPDLLALEPA